MLLSEREKVILQSLVKAHIATGEPVGSKTISRRCPLNMSPATIRNSMADLEEKGYVWQPHTSAGRIPTDKGYRCYVDHLMDQEELTESEKMTIAESMQARLREGDIEDILEQIARAIADVSKQLGLALSPRFEMGILHKLELVSLTEKRLLLVLTIRSGLVKTMVIEIDSKVSPEKLAETSQILNERLAGLSMREIRESIRERMESASRGDPELLRIFIDESDNLFNFSQGEDLHLGGTTNIFLQPEFRDRRSLTGLIDLLEEKEPIVYMLGQRVDRDGIEITIGTENPAHEMQVCSLLTSAYRVGDVIGIIGLLGPTRMRYPKLISLVEYMAQLTGDLLTR